MPPNPGPSPYKTENDLMRATAHQVIDATHAGIRQNVLDRQLARAWVGMIDDPEWGTAKGASQYDVGRDPTIPRGSVWQYDDHGGRDVERCNATADEIGNCRPEGWLPLPERP